VWFQRAESYVHFGFRKLAPVSKSFLVFRALSLYFCREKKVVCFTIFQKEGVLKMNMFEVEVDLKSVIQEL